MRAGVHSALHTSTPPFPAQDAPNPTSLSPAHSQMGAGGSRTSLSPVHSPDDSGVLAVCTTRRPPPPVTPGCSCGGRGSQWHRPCPNSCHSKATRVGAGAPGQVCAQVQSGRGSGMKSKCQRHRLLRSPSARPSTHGRDPARRPDFSSLPSARARSEERPQSIASAATSLPLGSCALPAII